MTQRLGNNKNGQGSRSKFETCHKQARGQNMKINTVTQTKSGVYKYVYRPHSMSGHQPVKNRP